MTLCCPFLYKRGVSLSRLTFCASLPYLMGWAGKGAQWGRFGVGWAYFRAVCSHMLAWRYRHGPHHNPNPRVSHSIDFQANPNPLHHASWARRLNAARCQDPHILYQNSQQWGWSLNGDRNDSIIQGYGGLHNNPPVPLFLRAACSPGSPLDVERKFHVGCRTIHIRS